MLLLGEYFEIKKAEVCHQARLWVDARAERLLSLVLYISGSVTCWCYTAAKKDRYVSRILDPFNILHARWRTSRKKAVVFIFKSSSSAASLVKSIDFLILYLFIAFRTPKVEGGSSSSPGNWCIFGLLLGLAQLLLHGALGLVLFWVFQYRGGFGWRENPQLEFNYHPVLMIGGFIYLLGNGIINKSIFSVSDKPITKNVSK